MAGCYQYLATAKYVGAFTVVYGLFLSFGELGPGDNIGLIASKTSATAIRGQYYGIAAAVGKVRSLSLLPLSPLTRSPADRRIRRNLCVPRNHPLRRWCQHHQRQPSALLGQQHTLPIQRAPCRILHPAHRPGHNRSRGPEVPRVSPRAGLGRESAGPETAQRRRDQ